MYQILLNHLNDNNALANNQFGFRPGRSTVTPLLLATHAWHTYMEKHYTISCVFFDLRKAFDSVPHQALLNKLHGLNLPTHIFNWITDYLSNRYQQVVYCGVTSHVLPVTSGVPQGSILGPLLFLLYINDLPSSLSDGASTVLYADDILLYKPIRSNLDRSSFQLDVTLITNWISNNHLTINTSKTKSMTISRARTTVPLQIYITGSLIEEVKHFKYLGVWDIL